MASLICAVIEEICGRRWNGLSELPIGFTLELCKSLCTRLMRGVHAAAARASKVDSRWGGMGQMRRCKREGRKNPHQIPWLVG